MAGADACLVWLEGALEKRRAAWLLLVVWFALLLSVLMAVPNLKAFQAGALEAYQLKAEQPLYDLLQDYAPGSHEAKINLRLTVPVGLYAVGLSGPWVLGWVSVAAVIALFALVGWQVASATGDRVCAALFVFFLSQTYVGMFGWPFLNYDPVAWLLLFAAFLRRPFWVSGLMVFLALWTDERAFLAALIPLFYHAFTTTGWERLRLLGGGIGAYLVTLLLRWYLALEYGLTIPIREEEVWVCAVFNLSFLHTAFLYSLEGGWLLIAAAIYLAWKQGKRMLAWAFAGICLMVFASAFGVEDLSRGLSFAMPATLMAVLLLAKLESSRQALRRLLLLAFFVSLALSTYVVFAYPYFEHDPEGWVRWMRPLPIHFVEIFLPLPESVPTTSP